MKPDAFRQSNLSLALLLLILVVAAFWRLPGNSFITYDDPFYVTKNPDVNSGLTWRNVQWAFTAMHASNWHPLTWISHMVDCQLFGLNPAAHHLMNLGWHFANTLLLFALLLKLTGHRWRGWFVAALFAVHPMHVESVAWVSERKDVLSAFFGLLTLLAYTAFVGKFNLHNPGRKVWYVLALVCYALGLLSKPMLVTLPCVLLLLDFWPLRRVEWRFDVENLNRFSRLVLEKIPFFLLTFLSCAITIIAQKRGGSVAPTIDINLTQRAINSVIAYGWYVWRLWVPVDQAIIYPLLPERAAWQYVSAGLCLLAFSGWVLWNARKQPWLLFGWLWFLGVLVPVIGLVQVGMQAYADRYTYLAYIGLFVAVVWTVSHCLQERQTATAAVATLGLVLVLGCVFATQHVLRFWKDDDALYRRALAVTRNNYIALNNLGFALSERGEYDEALKYCEASLQIAPLFAEAHNTIGCVRLSQKRPDLALPAFERAVSCRPSNPMYRNNLGTALHELQRYDEAVRAYEAALAVDHDYVDAYYNLGNSLGALGRSEAALAAYRRAIELRPSFADAHLNLGYELLKAGRRSEARDSFDNALLANSACVNAHYALGQLNNEEDQFAEAERQFQLFLAEKPGHIGALVQLTVALIGEKRYADAITEARKAIELAPEQAPAYYWLATALEQSGDLAAARQMYEQTLALAPDHVEALNNLAWLLTSNRDARLRDGPRAVRLAQRACELTKNESALLLGTLAAAHAEAGQFEDAVRIGQLAASVAAAGKDAALAERNRKYVEWYQARKTWIEGHQAQTSGGS